MNKAIHQNTLVPLSMVGVAILSGAFLLSTKTHADDVVSTATITVPVACTMSGSGMDSHTAEVPNGTTVENIGTTTLKVYCNDSEGFSVYAVGFSGDTLGNTYLRDATLGQSDDILTGTTFAGTSQWAMKVGTTAGTYPSTIAGSTDDTEKDTGDTDYSTWAEIPSQYTRVAYRNSGTDVDNNNIANAEGSSITTTYKAFISNTQPAGTYVGKVKYTMVHPASEEPLQPQPATSGCINYFANASDALGSMGCQSATDNASVTLLASNFSRTGYGFAGWSDAYDYATNPNANFYGPQEDITVPTGTTANGLSLYAVWVKSQGSIQDSSKVASVCNALTTAPTNGTANLSSVSALTDTRDNQTYAIAKLADGKCWMIENLRLADTHQEGSNTVATTLTLANTNNPLNDGTNVTLKHNYTDTTTSNTLSATSSVAYNADTAPDGWCTNTNAACYNQSRLRTDNTANRATNNPNSNSSAMYSYGNYYNWYSATAGRGTYSKSSGETEGDLCPSGWHLPLGNTSTGDISQGASDTANRVGGFSYLDRKMGGTGASQSTTADSLRWRKFPVNYLYSGYVIGGSLDVRGTGGYFWSSTAYNSDGAYGLYLSSSYVNPGSNNYYKYNGRTLRCMASS